MQNESFSEEIIFPKKGRVHMKVKHISIAVYPEQTGNPVFGAPADLTAYILEPVEGITDKKRPAVLLCPGGGYHKLSGREDQPIAMKYLAAGFHVFVLHYSLVPDVFPRALMELALSMKLIREHGNEWNVDVKRIAVSGFSAGGHLACCLGTFWNKEWLYKALEVKPEIIQPNGMILCYPVITSEEYCHKGSFECLMGTEASKKDMELRRLLSLEYQVGPQVPKTFLWHTWTDQSVPVENSLLLLQALRKAGVNVEAHLYPMGPHGIALGTEETQGIDQKYLAPYCESWMGLAIRWISEQL